MLVQDLCNLPNNEHYTEHQSEFNDPFGSSVWDQNKDHLRSQGGLLLSFHPLSPTNPLRLMVQRDGLLSAELTDTLSETEAH